MDLIRHLQELGHSQASGRLDVDASIAGRIYFEAGGVCGAEQHGEPTMLLAMADAGLFTPPEWAAAYKAPPPERWLALVGGDERRHADLVAFARDFVSRQLTAIVERPARSAVFVAGARHSLGPLATWPVADLVRSSSLRLRR
jgi:hypothetical protein